MHYCFPPQRRATKNHALTVDASTFTPPLLTLPTLSKKPPPEEDNGAASFPSVARGVGRRLSPKHFKKSRETTIVVEARWLLQYGSETGVIAATPVSPKKPKHGEGGGGNGGTEPCLLPTPARSRRRSGLDGGFEIVESGDGTSRCPPVFPGHAASMT